jgi:hypothetical protein
VGNHRFPLSRTRRGVRSRIGDNTCEVLREEIREFELITENNESEESQNCSETERDEERSPLIIKKVHRDLDNQTHRKEEKEGDGAKGCVVRSSKQIVERILIREG